MGLGEFFVSERCGVEAYRGFRESLGNKSWGWEGKCELSTVVTLLMVS
jgi:hypothetical protein